MGTGVEKGDGAGGVFGDLDGTCWRGCRIVDAWGIWLGDEVKNLENGIWLLFMVPGALVLKDPRAKHEVGRQLRSAYQGCLFMSPLKNKSKGYIEDNVVHMIQFPRLAQADTPKQDSGKDDFHTTPPVIILSLCQLIVYSPSSSL